MGESIADSKQQTSYNKIHEMALHVVEVYDFNPLKKTEKFLILIPQRNFRGDARTYLVM